MKVIKLILMLMLSLAFSVGVSAAVAPELGVSVTGMSVGMFGSSILIGAFVPKQVLPMAINISTSYAGEVLEKLLVRATTKNELVERRLIKLVPGIKKKYYIPRMKVGRMLQKRKEMPASEDSKGDFDIDERVLEPQEFMAYTEFNPRSFEKFWRPYQPKGPLVFRELPPEVQSKLLAELAKSVDFELGKHFINGEFGIGDDKLFNGIITRIDADADKNEVENTTILTAENIASELEKVRKLIPKAIRKHPDLKILCSIETADLYDAYLTGRSHKGSDETNVNPMKYKGIPIESLSEFPDNYIICTIASDDFESNLWAGVDFVDDDEVIQIDKVTNAGERYFFKMLMKADTNTAFGEDIVVYDARRSDKNILGVTVPGQIGTPTINTSSHTVSVNVSPGTDLTAIAPSFKLSSGANIYPPSGSVQDFTGPVTYIVEGEDGSEIEWEVIINA